MLTEALRLSGEVSAVKVPQPSRLTLISEGLPGRGVGGGGGGGGLQGGRGQEGSELGERPIPLKINDF